MPIYVKIGQVMMGYALLGIVNKCYVSFMLSHVITSQFRLSQVR
jgi:hypothetical protein